jgi:regulator of replication initiation timing
MKKLIFLLPLLAVFACSKTSEQHHSDTSVNEDNPNQALYDQVMDIHDEVMPRMGEIQRLKRELTEKIENSPDMVIEQKQELERVISNLDSASHEMMDWMHKFKPEKDSVDQEKAREYLEVEMEKIKKVRELMNESIEKAKEASSKQ